MARTLKPLIAGNWKMHGLGAALDEARAIAEGARERAAVDALLCPPATLLARMALRCAGTPLMFGGQDCHADVSGAFTGDVSAAMLADAGASFVIVGHSERRTLHGESDAAVRAKAVAASASGLVPIICVGETLSQRDAGQTLSVVTGQLRGSLPEAMPGIGIVIAYEPVWAIGTGRTPTPADVAEVHAGIRAELGRLIGDDQAALTRLLYGGSVKPSNAAELLALPNVNGALVGGASLKAADFLAIIDGAG
jgi:triosephosphate isomerase (TIM)